MTERQRRSPSQSLPLRTGGGLFTMRAQGSIAGKKAPQIVEGESAIGAD